jgi:hypothetical protein
LGKLKPKPTRLAVASADEHERIINLESLLVKYGVKNFSAPLRGHEDDPERKAKLKNNWV